MKSKKNKEDITPVKINDLRFDLHTPNRSLKLCAKMNYETENLDFINTIPNNSVLYDLGACEGRFTVYAKVKGIKTYSFEPDPDNFDMLIKNLSLNKLSNEDIFNIAIGNKNEQKTLTIGQPWPGGHQKVIIDSDSNLRQDIKFTTAKEVSVKMMRLDDFIANNKVEFPNFMKIDIDGSELSFLEGALNTLKDKRLLKILFEVNVVDQNYSKILAILKNCGLKEKMRYAIPNENEIFNILFSKKPL